MACSISGMCLRQWLCAVLLTGAGGCATAPAPGAGAVGGRAGSDPRFGGGLPELVATASVRAAASGPAVPVVASQILEAEDWPVVNADSAAGTLLSEWQLFELAEPLRGGQRGCRDVMALRLVLRPLAQGAPGGQLTAEAYFPRTFRPSPSEAAAAAGETLARISSDLSAARGQARSVLDAFQKALTVALAEGDGAASLRNFARTLDSGTLVRCR